MDRQGVDSEAGRLLPSLGWALLRSRYFRKPALEPHFRGGDGWLEDGVEEEEAEKWPLQWDLRLVTGTHPGWPPLF